MKKTKTGLISTARHALIGREDEFSKTLLKYRELKKIISTYIEPILENLDGQNRLHGTFNQSVTTTGRLSSSSPINLQNIPSRGKYGKKIRECFIGDNIIVADMDQIELRLLAHFSQ